ncbi:MAG: NAD-dependent epimerase/dehydratase family protein [Acidobacteriota bacterium]|jgi:CDP-glucose 4,6-dehydratase|nr:NAD-dependent epimerase/dehydratase family protein [Acidobacteriota bacterium]
MFWKNRNVFVTGATGFIGANLVKKLVELGANVVCLQRDVVKLNSLDVLGLQKKVTIINGSVENLDLMSRILNEYEINAVFHLAAQALVGVANRSPLSTFESNIRGTYILLEACRQNSIVERIVVASSDKAYGIHTELPYEEDFSLNGLYPYDVSKTCTDLLAQSFASSYDVPVSIIRSANVYGECDLNLSRIIPGTIISILKNENPIIRSDGTPIREFIYTEDIVNGYLLLAEQIDKSKGEAFNFGTDNPTQMLDLVNLILRLMKKENELEPDILLKNKIKNEIDAQYLSSKKVKEYFNWSPEIPLENGLEKTIDWYSSNEQLFV